MELLDRYLQAVKKHLPLKRQDDIVAELKANLESQLEEKEAELGRPLTKEEAEAWLKQIGPPLQMAARYQPQQYLIGPTVFPTYWYVLRIACLWALVAYAVGNALMFATGSANGASVMAVALRAPSLLMTVVLWVTLVFAALEFFARQYPGKCPPEVASFTAGWSPSSLPPLEREVAPGTKRRSYAQSVAEVVFGFLLLIWLLVIPQHPFLLFGPGAVLFAASPYKLAPVWMTFFWWIVVLNAVQLVWRTVNLMRKRWQNPHPVRHIVFKALGLAAIGWLLSAPGHLLVLLRHPEVDQARYGATLEATNKGVYTAMSIICLIAAVQLVVDIVQLGRAAYRRRVATQ